MSLVLDSGALVALERNDRAMWRRLKAAHHAGQVPITHAGVLAQVWRGGGPRHALVARALAGIDVRAIDERLGRSTGELLGRARRSDVIDAALVLLSADGDFIVTSDPDDIEPLATAAQRHIEVVLT